MCEKKKKVKRRVPSKKPPKPEPTPEPKPVVIKPTPAPAPEPKIIRKVVVKKQKNDNFCDIIGIMNNYHLLQRQQME